MLRLTGAFLTSVLVFSCAASAQAIEEKAMRAVVPPVAATDLQMRYSLSRGWSEINTRGLLGAGVRAYTADGPLLSALFIAQGLRSGGALLSEEGSNPPPRFRAGMASTEQIELIATFVANLRYSRVETFRPRPGGLTDGPSLRLDLTARSPEGLPISGTALVAERQGKLYFMLFLAPATHFYDAALPEIDAAFQGVTFVLGPGGSSTPQKQF